MRLMRGDCLERMKELEDGSIDMVMTDPPYGTTACKWDSIIPLEPMWEHLKRVIKPNGAIVMTGSEPFSSVLRLSNTKDYKYDWKWEKPNGANFLNANYQPMKVHEDVMVFSTGATSYSPKSNYCPYNSQDTVGTPYTQGNGKQRIPNNNSSVRSPIEQVVTVNKGSRTPRSIVKFSLDKDKCHPTQKPVALMEYLIKTYTNEGETVLDFTMGSGTTGVACANLKRGFIGIEMDDQYFDIASKRITEALNEKETIPRACNA